MALPQPKAKRLFDELVEFLMGSLPPEQVLAFKPSEALDDRLHELLDKNSETRLTPDEQAELDDMLRLGHLVNMLKIRAELKLTGKA